MKFHFFRFLFNQLKALIVAVLAGWVSGQVLSLLPEFLLKQVSPSFLASIERWIPDLFWIVPFLVSLCVSVMISLAYKNTARKKAAA